MITTNIVSDVRNQFSLLLREQQFTSINREASMTSLMGNKTIEIIGANFDADDVSIFGKVNESYVKRESEWYHSMSRNVNDFPGGAPEVWKAIAAKDGTINSNYGFCVWSGDNYKQYNKVLCELRKNPESRRAVMIYTRPTMWFDYNHNGRSDFMCTNVVQYVIRNGSVHCVVQMRSNDSVIGYKNDRAWQEEVLQKVADALNLPMGKIHWQVGSLHVYQRDFYLVDHYDRTGESIITKARYRELYPESPYSEKT